MLLLLFFCTEVIVGVNKYKPTEEQQVDVLCIDNKHVREEQIARLKKTRQNRDHGKVGGYYNYYN